MRASLFILSGIQFLLIAWISHSIGSEQLSLFAIATGIFAPIAALLSSGQRVAILTNHENQQHNIQSAITIRIVTLLSVIILSATAITTLRTDTPLTPSILIAAGLNRIFDGLQEIESWQHQLNNNSRRFTHVTLSRVGAITSGILFTWITSGDVETYLYASSAASLIFIGLLHRANIPTLKIIASKYTTPSRSFARASAVVGLAGGIESAAIITPRYILQNTANSIDIALYTIATQIAIGFGIIASIHLQFALPNFKRIDSNNPENKSYKKPLFESATLAGALTITSAITINLPSHYWKPIFGSWFEFSNTMQVTLPIMIGLWYSSGYLANAIHSMIDESWLTITSITTTATTLTLLFIAGQMGDQPITSETVIQALLAGFLLRLIISIIKLMKNANTI